MGDLNLARTEQYIPSVISVSMYPGRTQLTRTPPGPSSAARERVKPSINYLASQLEVFTVRDEHTDNTSFRRRIDGAPTSSLNPQQ